MVKFPGRDFSRQEAPLRNHAHDGLIDRKDTKGTRDMKIMFLAFAVLAFTVAPAIPADAITLSYGTGKTQVGFINQNNQPGIEELQPWGPLSFRVHGGEFWVADTVGGRILHLSNDAKLLRELDIGTTSAMLEDIALKLDAAGKVEGVLALRSDTQEAVLMSLDGKVLTKYGGQGDGPGKFLQATFVDVSPSGNVFVADTGSQVLCVFNPDGSVLREMHWEWSGFALDPAGNLARLQWDDKAKIGHLVIETPAGKKINDIGLQIEEHTNPKLWMVGKDGSSLVTYIPPEGFKGEYAWVICDKFGKVTSSGRVKPPVVMNRYLAQDTDGTWYLGVGDYNEAPNGNLKFEKHEFK